MITQDDVTSLAAALVSSDDNAALPSPLPIAHVTVGRWFADIVAAGELRPRECKVFSAQVLYLSYGGAFYRPSPKPTNRAADVPVAFLFGPRRLRDAWRFAAFDTGAHHEGLFGSPWTEDLTPINPRFTLPADGSVKQAPALVHHFYGSNAAYLRGSALGPCSHPNGSCTRLHEFLGADLTSLGVDKRQRSIEVQFDKAIRLEDETLMWVGFPEQLQSIYGDLVRHLSPHVPTPYPYTFAAGDRPSELAKELEVRAASYTAHYVNAR